MSNDSRRQGASDKQAVPSREAIVQRTAHLVYGKGILNNAHRGDVVEAMVLEALGDDWRHVSPGWHPWDLQRGQDSTRQRIQVKQTAALQIWTPKEALAENETPMKNRSLSFGWKSHPPFYFKRDNPDERIEPCGWFCELFVVGIHDEMDHSRADQADPRQWQFMVIPTSDLTPGQNTISLSKARSRWDSVTWNLLNRTVEAALTR